MNRIPLLLTLLCWFVIVGFTKAQQITFSVDVQGPTAGLAGNDATILDTFFGEEIDGGDILTVGRPVATPLEPNIALRGPVPEAPGILVFGIDPGIPDVRTLNLAPTLIGARSEPEAELDALSFGRDVGRAIFFSVDEFSNGLGGGVLEQSLMGEASADVFRVIEGPEGSVLTVDGRGGQSPHRALGLGLVEPNPPGPLSDLGDNLDALDVNTQPMDLAGPIYFSLDAAFDDSLEAPGPNNGSAQQNGVGPADILIMPEQSRGLEVYLPASALGLDRVADDVDALALFDAAQDGRFDPTQDALLFSVRRDSQIVGQQDSAFGFPISPGDILTLPLEPGATPQIFLPAEAMGLNANRDFGPIANISEPAADDLDALSLGIQDGDMNCNAEWDAADVSAFALALESSLRYESTFFSVCFGPSELHGDLNLDGRFGFQDIEDFVRIMSNAGALDPAAVEALLGANVPEPGRLAWLIGGVAWCIALRRKQQR